MKRILMLFLVLSIFLLTISSAVAFLGIGEDDLIDVISVGIYDDYSGGSFGGAIAADIMQRENDAYAESIDVEPTYEQWGDVKVKTSEGSSHVGYSLDSENEEIPDYDITLGILINFKPKEDIKDITAIRLENLEVTYQDGSVQPVGNFSFNEEDVYPILEKDQNYSIPCQYVLDQNLWNESIKLIDFYGNGHVKADMVINTTSETNKVIGHIDDDVTMSG